jgi:hypothetical protein
MFILFILNTFCVHLFSLNKFLAQSFIATNNPVLHALKCVYGLRLETFLI